MTQLRYRTWEKGYWEARQIAKEVLYANPEETSIDVLGEIFSEYSGECLDETYTPQEGADWIIEELER